MSIETIAMICAAIAVVLAPIYVYLLVKGVRTLGDLRDYLRRPVPPRSAGAPQPQDR